MSNVMTPARLAAMKRLREAEGTPYDGANADSYEMFLLVDECFPNPDHEVVATWLPATGDTPPRELSYALVAYEVMLFGNHATWEYWAVRIGSDNSLSDSDCHPIGRTWAGVRWYMPLNVTRLPMMKFQSPLNEGEQ